MCTFWNGICVIGTLVIGLQTVYSANILFVSITPSISHQRAFQPVWRELSLRGHNVHAVTTDPLKDPSLTNLTEYDVSSLYNLLRSVPTDTRDYILKKPNFLVVFLKDALMTRMFSRLGEVALQHDEMQRLLNTDIKFDAVIAEWLFPTLSALGAKYKCPLIGISSLGAPLVALDTVGNPSHPIASPDHNLPVTRDMPFRERLMSALYSVYVRTWYRLVVLPREDATVKKYIGEDLPYLGDIERNVSVLLLNRNPVFHKVMPVVPAIIELGGISLNRTKPKLEADLQKFLDKSKQRAIYFSFGSNLKSIYLPDDIRNLFLNVFRQLPYNVIFKWENDTLPGKPDNVFIAKWLPQLTVLVIPSLSHQRAFQPLWKELSLKGHHVHAVTTDPLREPFLTNLTEYDLSSLYDIVNNASEHQSYLLVHKLNFLKLLVKNMFITSAYSLVNEKAFQHKEIKKLLGSNITFDVVVAEWNFPTMGALAAKFECPLIGISSSTAPMVSLDTVGNPSHPITSPDNNLFVGRDLAFRERLLSVLHSVFVRAWHHLVTLPREDILMRRYLGGDLPYLGDIERNVSVLLSNRNFVFHRIMPMVVTVIEIGGIGLNRTKEEAEPELQQFLDESKQGVIFFSMGTNMKTIYLSYDIRKLLLSVFKQLPYNVICKWENDSLPEKPENVFISKWLPQLAVLDHPNTKLFITQGGLQSSEEAIHAEVPIIGFPTHSDQTVNVDTFVKYGAGIGLDLDDLTFEKLNTSIYEIMTNPRYKENAKTLASLMYDQPVDGLERAVWWIEYVIRHKGARHLRSPILDIPWWQYFMLDVVGFLLAVLTVILLIIYLILKTLCWLLKRIARVTCYVCGTGKKEHAKKRQ